MARVLLSSFFPLLFEVLLHSLSLCMWLIHSQIGNMFLGSFEMRIKSVLNIFPWCQALTMFVPQITNYRTFCPTALQ
jgi:hypothetical protein